MDKFMAEFRTILEEDFPELCLDVVGDRSCPTVAVAMGYVGLSFPVDEIEWMRQLTTKAKRNLIRVRLLDTLKTLKEFNDKAIIKCGGTV